MKTRKAYYNSANITTKMSRINANPLLSPAEVQELLADIKSLTSYYSLTAQQIQDGYLELNRECLSANSILGGSYEDLDKVYKGRKGKLEVNHMPPNIVYSGTAYQNISEKKRPCILMDYDDHREYITTGNQNRRLGGYNRMFNNVAHYNANLKSGMIKNDFKDALFVEIRILLSSAEKMVKYAKAVQQMIIYCGNPIASAPPIA